MSGGSALKDMSGKHLQIKEPTEDQVVHIATISFAATIQEKRHPNLTY